MRLGSLLAAFVVATTFGLAANAAPAPPAVARAGGGQQSLAVGFDARGELRAAVCMQAPCSVEGGTLLGLPRDIRDAREKARIAIVGIGNDRRVVVVTVPTESPSRRFEAVVAAPLAGATPNVLFAGFTGLAQGEDGVRRGGMVIVGGPDAAGARSVAIGEQREELTLCGRPTILAPRQIDPRDLTLRPARVQRLDADERARAPRLVATRATGEAGPAPSLLRAVGASSAVGNPAALTDGNVETTWAENGGGAGKGEFVLMNAPAELPLEGLELVVRPVQAAPERAVSPRELWVATEKQLFLVTLPEDAWAAPGARYVVRFPAPVAGDCLALAIESGFDERLDARVTLAEVRAQTSLGSADLSTLVAALRGGGQKADGAKAMLRSSGTPGFEAVAAAFRGLDEGGRRVALEVLDSAPCTISAPAYVEALVGPHAAQRTHARDRLPRCGTEAAPLLAAQLETAKGRSFAQLSDDLARIAPGPAVALFVPWMTGGAAERRAAIRTALGRIAGTRDGSAAFRKVLSDPATPPAALLELLRALGARAVDVAPEAVAALARTNQTDFRTRYLRVGPAAELAARDVSARALVAEALVRDTDPRVRANAARSVRNAQSFQAELVRALADENVRVRIEAAQALAGAPSGPAVPALLARVEDDRWPAVRALAVTALGASPAAPAVDARLARAVEEDESWHVRRAALGALGTRGARAHAEIALERLEDAEERAEVRAAAARALGALCFEPATGKLTSYARRLADPFASPDDRSISYAALGALRDLAPRDLQSRLSPLLAKDAPRGARAAAEAAVRERAPGCRKR